MPLSKADNPPIDRPVTFTRPENFPVTAAERPIDIRDLISHKEITSYDDWEYDIGDRHLFYVTGIVSFIRMFKARRIVFLKDEGFTDRATNALSGDGARWSAQANFKWEEPISANQLRRVRDKEAVSFTKAVHTILACEFALESLLPHVPCHWVYDYMRVLPAVYNIDEFNTGTVEQILKSASERSLQALFGPDAIKLLRDLADGYCVTAETAYSVADFASDPKGPACQIGDVRFRPGKRRLGKKVASPHEFIELY